MTAPRAMVSSDWNQCLAPCGPFDCISFTYPELAAPLEDVFKAYTGNRIPLGRAVARIEGLLPGPLSGSQMDAYLRAGFEVYRGVPELIEWCGRNHVLFMLNTTGAIGYFQRALALGLLPTVAVLSAHPMIRYPRSGSDPNQVLPLLEITDKGRHTAFVAKAAGIPAGRVIVMGDSGGDGPHFAWAAAAGALRIGSMTKASLADYCRARDIGIDLQFGLKYDPGEVRSPQDEMAVDFTGLIPEIEAVLAR